MVSEEDHGSVIDDITNEFVRNLEALKASLPMVMRVMLVSYKKADSSYRSFLEKYGTPLGEDDGVREYAIKAEHIQEAVRLSRMLDNSEIACDILPQSFVVSLVSQYDLFLGKLVSTFHQLKPQLLGNSEHQFKLSQLIELGSVEAARTYVIEKETESLLRQSHTDQFTSLENRFTIRLRQDLPAWPKFVELTERRNLFVHTGGIVSTQYLRVCRTHNCPVAEGCKLGDKLDVTHSYFRSACDCVFEVGVKLAQVLRRSQFPLKLKQADINLNTVIFDLLSSDQLSLAINLGEFANKMPPMKHADDELTRMLQINWAQAYKWNGDRNKCQEILERMDWSASKDMFVLAVQVLTDEYDRAVSTMKRIGADGEISEDAYKTWPLFRAFRQTKAFQDAFAEVFHHPFTEIATSMQDKPLQAAPPLDSIDEPLSVESIEDRDVCEIPFACETVPSPPDTESP